MKRFWTAVSTDAERVVRLDERPVRTPGRVPLALPSAALAEAVADEWRAVGETIDPRTMPLTGLANAAIDRIGPDPALFVAAIARYGASDLLCYRAEDPPELAARQAAAWDPPLDWARARYDVAFAVTAGVVPVAQQAATLERLERAVAARGAFALAALTTIVSLTGSLVLGLAVAERAFDTARVWQASELDEAWQAELWGVDEEAMDRRRLRREEFERAALFLALAEPDRV